MQLRTHVLAEEVKVSQREISVEPVRQQARGKSGVALSGKECRPPYGATRFWYDRPPRLMGQAAAQEPPARFSPM